MGQIGGQRVAGSRTATGGPLATPQARREQAFPPD